MENKIKLQNAFKSVILISLHNVTHSGHQTVDIAR